MHGQAHRALGREAVRKSLVLLKNGKGSKRLLPLSKSAKKILVVGAHANDIGLQCGGWTISWQGMPGNTTKGAYLDIIPYTLLSSSYNLTHLYL